MTETRVDPENLEQTSAVPTAEEAELAAQSSTLLARYLDQHTAARLRLIDSDQELNLPMTVLPLLQKLLEQLGRGNAVTLTPIKTELSTQQAADLLNVSRPYVVKLLEQGGLPFRRVGNRRRLRLSDVLAYKQRQDADRRRALAALVDQAEELDMGY